VAAGSLWVATRPVAVAVALARSSGTDSGTQVAASGLSKRSSLEELVRLERVGWRLNRLIQRRRMS